MEKNLPMFSIVVPAHNEEKEIGRTIDCLLAQDYKGKIEVIIVDNKSTDKTAEVAKRHGAIVVYENRAGVAFARQAGFERANGDIIATTDADTILPPQWISLINKEFEKNPEVLAVSGMFTFYDGTARIKLFFDLFGETIFRAFNMYSGTNIAIKKSAFEKIGGFDLKLVLAEDTDIMRRLSSEGEIVRMKNNKVETSARRYMQLGLIGGMWYYVKNYAKNKYVPDGIPIGPAEFHSGSVLQKPEPMKSKIKNKLSPMLEYELPEFSMNLSARPVQKAYRNIKKKIKI